MPMTTNAGSGNGKTAFVTASAQGQGLRPDRPRRVCHRRPREVRLVSDRTMIGRLLSYMLIQEGWEELVLGRQWDMGRV